MTDQIDRAAVLELLETAAKGTIILGGQKYRTIQLEEIAAAIRALPAVKDFLTADPLSDPRVKALVEAARRIDGNYVADCECDECCLTRLDLSAALRAIGGEA